MAHGIVIYLLMTDLFGEELSFLVAIFANPHKPKRRMGWVAHVYLHFYLRFKCIFLVQVCVQHEPARDDQLGARQHRGGQLQTPGQEGESGLEVCSGWDDGRPPGEGIFTYLLSVSVSAGPGR